MYEDMLVANTIPKGRSQTASCGPGFSSMGRISFYQIHDQEDEQLWLENAKSAAKYFGSQVQEYESRISGWIC